MGDLFTTREREREVDNKLSESKKKSRWFNNIDSKRKYENVVKINCPPPHFFFYSLREKGSIMVPRKLDVCRKIGTFLE